MARTAAQQRAADANAAFELQRILDRVGPGVRKVLGFDLSFTKPGFAVLYPDGQLHSEHLKLEKLPPNERLKLTGAKALQLALGGHESYPADVIFVEQPFSTADNGSKIWMAHGAVRSMLAAGGWDGPVIEVHQAQGKAFACPGLPAGSGKDPLVAVARQRFGMAGRDPDEADAVIIGAFGRMLLSVHFGELLPPPGWDIPDECMRTVIKMATGVDPAGPKSRRKKVAA